MHHDDGMDVGLWSLRDERVELAEPGRVEADVVVAGDGPAAVQRHGAPQIFVSSADAGSESASNSMRDFAIAA